MNGKYMSCRLFFDVIMIVLCRVVSKSRLCLGERIDTYIYCLMNTDGDSTREIDHSDFHGFLFSFLR